MPRLFISTDLPPNLEPRLKDLQSKLSMTNADLKFNNPSQAHFTLKFIGNTDQEHIPEIEKILSEVVGEIEPFSVELGGVGVFPSPDHINVIWVGVTSGGEKLSSLHEAIEKRIVSEGIAGPEDHDFTPHVTLGRMNSGRGKSEIQRFLDEHSDLDLGEMEVSDVKLKESTLTDEGSIHETRFKASLRGEMNR